MREKAGGAGGGQADRYLRSKRMLYCESFMISTAASASDSFWNFTTLINNNFRQAITREG